MRRGGAALSSQHWALATFLIPIATSTAYGIWLITSATGLADSPHAENFVRAGALALAGVFFAVIPQPWARSIAVASAAGLVHLLLSVLLHYPMVYAA